MVVEVFEGELIASLAVVVSHVPRTSGGATGDVVCVTFEPRVANITSVDITFQVYVSVYQDYVDDNCVFGRFDLLVGFIYLLGGK
jgi:hypothetical protein